MNAVTHSIGRQEAFNTEKAEDHGGPQELEPRLLIE